MSEVQDPRWVEVWPSRLGLIVSTIGAAMVVGVLCLINLPMGLRVFLAFAVSVLLALDLWWLRLKARGSVQAFQLIDRPLDRLAGPANRSRLRIRVRMRGTLATGPIEREGEVQDGGFVTPWFTSVLYSTQGDPAWRRVWPRLLTLWPDGLDAERFREVRVRLKWS